MVSEGQSKTPEERLLDELLKASEADERQGTRGLGGTSAGQEAELRSETLSSSEDVGSIIDSLLGAAFSGGLEDTGVAPQDLGVALLDAELAQVEVKPVQLETVPKAEPETIQPPRTLELPRIKDAQAEPILDRPQSPVDSSPENTAPFSAVIPSPNKPRNSFEAGLQEPDGGQSQESGDDFARSGGLERQIVLPPERRHIWPVCITALLIFILIVGGATYYNRTVLALQAAERASVERTGDELLNESIALIQEADIVVVALDRATSGEVTEEALPKLEVLLDQVDSTQQSLDTAITKAKRAQDIFIDEDKKELAIHAQEAAEYRKQMLELSSQLTSYDIAAMQSALNLDYAWMLIIGADADMRAGVSAISSGGADAVSVSKDYNQNAFNKFGEAEHAIAKTAEIFPGVDLGMMSDYLAAKKACAELALASDEAFLAGDMSTANAKNEEFIVKDAEAVALVSTLTTDPVSLVVAAYGEATNTLRADYQKVRSLAADADAFLRAYLGVDVIPAMGDK